MPAVSQPAPESSAYTPRHAVPSPHLRIITQMTSILVYTNFTHLNPSTQPTVTYSLSHIDIYDRLIQQVIWHDASHSQWQEYALEIGEILHIFPSGTQSMEDRGSKKAYTGPRTNADQVWL